MVTLEGIVLWNNQPDREAFGLVRKGVGQSTVLRAVETPYPKVNPIQSNPIKSFTVWEELKSQIWLALCNILCCHTLVDVLFDPQEELPQERMWCTRRWFIVHMQSDVQ